MGPRTMAWILFAALACSLPLVYFMFAVAGLLPLVAILRLGLVGPWGLQLFTGLHLLVYVPLLWLAARRLGRWLFMLEPRLRAAGLAALLALALGVSMLPVYGVGHSDYAPVNLYRLFQGGRLGRTGARRWRRA